MQKCRCLEDLKRFLQIAEARKMRDEDISRRFFSNLCVLNEAHLHSKASYNTKTVSGFRGLKTIEGQTTTNTKGLKRQEKT